MYQREYAFLKECFEKCRIELREVTFSELLKQITEIETNIPFGDRYMQYWMRENLLQAKENTIYRFVDPFGCHYMFLIMPGEGQKTFLAVGPYFEKEQDDDTLPIKAEKFGLTLGVIRLLKEYYSSVPLLSDTSTLFAMLEVFCERIFGGVDQFSIVDLNQESLSLPISIIEAEDKIQESFVQRRKQMEQRYLYENQLIQSVRQGLTHKTELLFSGFTHFSFEQRLADPVRNLKNYSIIMNTLCRKAA